MSFERTIEFLTMYFKMSPKNACGISWTPRKEEAETAEKEEKGVLGIFFGLGTGRNYNYHKKYYNDKA